MSEDSISITSPTSLDSIPTSAMSFQPPDPLPEVPLPSTSSKEKTKEPVIEEDEDYFMQSSFVYFQVENRLFHVPNYRFTSESHIFSGMFKLPQPNAIDVEGASRNNPIKLPDGPDGIRHTDFKNFMKALYPLNVSLTLFLSKAEWISVLKLSSFWYFLSFRQMAISELWRMNELSSVQKIEFGRLVKISHWVTAGYSELIERDDPISKEEALLIDYETTFSLFRIRELRLKRVLISSMQAIENEFAWELKDIRAEEKGYEVVEEDLPISKPCSRPPSSHSWYQHEEWSPPPPLPPRSPSPPKQACLDPSPFDSIPSPPRPSLKGKPKMRR
ncbi:unnamed protein product [Cyclocybe aegerita]|uniref:BTB domain-containing protein n=1 Tax=Cyclocybe aegerita TaxID=1973307 RepID=A0A8S0XF31_CYCAE|nr:unnamed protein product [Cyclocybe aegerita]